MNNYCILKTPVGNLTAIANEKGLSAILWENDDLNRVRITPEIHNPNCKILQLAAIQLDEYFNKKRTIFTIPLDPIGTDFRLIVWRELQKIPYAQTINYGQLANRIGNSKAARAVGGANGKNPLSIVIPCHRVIGASGKLTGFAGGIDIKKKLIDFEQNQYPI